MTYGYAAQREGKGEYTVWLTSPHTGSKLEVLGWFSSLKAAKAFIVKQQAKMPLKQRP